jgi:hypothetical protein
MPSRRDWVRWPSRRVYEEKLLQRFHWRDGGKGSHVAALKCWIALAHLSDQETGNVRASFDTLSEITGMGRRQIAEGLRVLKAFEIISDGKTRGTYHMTGFDPNAGWAMLPWRSLYKWDTVAMFQNMSGRMPVHLDALKLFLLFAARRDTNTNTANITYDQIVELSGVPKSRISSAISFLAANQVLMVENRPSEKSDYGVSNGYRLRGVDAYRHRGTLGRASL